jgi:hypothetical protein
MSRNEGEKILEKVDFIYRTRRKRKSEGKKTTDDDFKKKNARKTRVQMEKKKLEKSHLL